jgi:serine/threonine-protein kinase
VLGSGGFGKVVLARHDASGTQVAIKYLHGDLLTDPDFAPLFRAEAAVLASLDDPNVVRLYEYVETPAGAAIVMELVNGITLRDILARQGKTTAEAALVVLQGSLLGLAAAHRRGVVHRDYKPENVLIDGAGASKLTDFGIAARAGDSPIPAGTLAYAPPEQFTGSPASPATDVYAATATFYECLTGQPPFDGKTAEALLRQHQAEPVPLEPVPEALRPLVAAGLAKDPGRRPADGAALVTELRAVAGASYGPDWEARGRSALAATALLLAALWPASALWPAGGGAAAHGAAQGTAAHLVRLRRLRHLRPRHVGPVKAVVAAGTAVAVGAVVVVATHHGRPAEPVNASFTVTGALGGAAATSADNAWTVGCADTRCTRPLILRWSGTGWTRVPAPDLGADYNLSSVAAASADNAWAVGWTGSGTSDQTNSRTVILHWNGRTWTRVPSPSPARDNMLLGVSVTATGNAWAYGITESGLPRTGDAELILHWNGRAWTQVPVPVPITDPTKGWIYDVTAVSADSAWAVGSLTDAAKLSVTLILRWNGSTWTRVPSPSPAENSFLTVVGAASADNAWAVGYTFANTASRGLIFMHWNGSTWTTAPGPDLADSVLTGTAVASDGTAWVVGWIAPGADHGNVNGRAETTLILRWNGTTWTRAPSPSPGPSGRLSGVTIISSSDAWATGTVDGKTLILRWNGQTWSGPAGPVSPATAPTSSAASSALSSPAASPASSPAASPASSAAASPALPPRQQAAQALAALLAQSGADRAAVTQAVGTVATCSPGLSQAETIFSNAASSHQALLGKLAALPDRSALPAPMLSDLTAAWQASAQADQDFAQWTRDEISHGCSTNYQSDASHQAARAPDDHATKDKQAFAALWAAIAGEYGLPPYQYSQI